MNNMYSELFGEELEEVLTETEKIAYEWVKNHGFSEIKRRTKTNGYPKAGEPDFRTDDELFEVKKLRYEKLKFTSAQLAYFEELDPIIIVIDNREVEETFPYKKCKYLAVS